MQLHVKTAGTSCQETCLNGYFVVVVVILAPYVQNSDCLKELLLLPKMHLCDILLDLNFSKMFSLLHLLSAFITSM